ncbi:KRBBA protein, partial [Ptilonorhynchus violaceus]|nr:KRBBA protein [Ptilonorhynchus violaceus]
EDCGNRGATLLLPWDEDELEIHNETVKKPTQPFWIRLWVPAVGTGWTWVNGSRLDQDRFQLDLGERPGVCGIIKGNSIIADNCTSELQWICEREGT